MKQNILTLVVGIILAVGLISYFNNSKKIAPKNFGASALSELSYSTTTDSTWKTFTKKFISECTQSIDRVLITNATAGSAFNIYDGTSTTDLSQKLIVPFSSTATSGSYPIERYLTRGLVVDMLSSNIASTTITCR